MQIITLNHIEELKSISFDSAVKIIAESGGTKTDWRIQTDDKIVAFETINFHPKTLNNEQVSIVQYLKNIIPKNSSLFFYGSGCLQQENQYIIHKLFEPLELIINEIASDLVAAGKAIYGKQSGYVGILGTGSVLCHYSDSNIENISGGLGYLLGDEGSGYYFGKLVLQKYFNNMCSSKFKELIEKTYGSHSEILSKVYGNEGKKFISQIQLNSNLSALNIEILEIHKENISLFLDLHLPKVETIIELGFVGSYAFHMRKLLEEQLTKRGIKLTQVIQKPIDSLMKYLF